MKRVWFLAAVLFAPFANAAYKCVDERGTTHIGDTPPPGCTNVVMYEISTSGHVLRKMDPTPTPEQLRAKQEEYERNRGAIRQQADQKRRDVALLNSFSSEREFDVVRDRNIEPLKNRISLAQERMKVIDKRQQEVEDEMEFYKAGKSKGKAKEIPPQLVADMQRLRNERTSLEKSVASSEKEIEEFRAKFDADKKRWLALKAGTRPGDDVRIEPKSVAVKPGDGDTGNAKAVKKN